MTAEIEHVYANRINVPFAEAGRTMLGGSTAEDRIIWRAGGIRDRLVDLERQVASLSALLGRAPAVADLDPDPSLEATTFYETASDGALRSGVQVVTSSNDYAIEVALLPAPTVQYAAKNALVDSAHPETNYDTRLGAGVGAGPAVWRGWIQFDWGTWAASGGSTGLWSVDPLLALVRLCKDGVSDVDDGNIALYPETFSGGDWAEDEITWANQPELEAAEAHHWRNRTADDYNWFDVTRYVQRVRGTKENGLDGEPYGLVVRAQDEDTISGCVSYYTRAEATATRRPQLWYWTAALKTVILGPALRDAKFYGTPGTTYYLTHRALGKNNQPSRWSVPVQITLPAQGAKPAAPPTPAMENTNFSNMKHIILTTSTPTDFAAYEVEIYCSAETKYIKTTSDRLELNFTSGLTYRDYKLRYRFVTRSGVTSDWSPYCSSFRVARELKIQQADASDGNAYILIDSNGDTHFYHVSGSSSRTYDYIESQPSLLLLDAPRTVKHYSLDASCGQASYDTAQSTDSTSYVDRVNGSITLTPPGVGNAYYLVIGRMTVFKDSGASAHVSCKVDNVLTSDEECYSASGTAETATFARRVAVKAGIKHVFKLVFRSGGGGRVTVYRSNLVVTHIGNY